jgi:hypothetical protein
MGNHQAKAPAEPQPPTEAVPEPVAETTDEFSTPRASVGWSKRKKGR